MKKTTTRFWVDVVLFISLFGLVVTGILMAFFTDSGPNVKEASKYFLDLHRHQWGEIHFYFAIVFVIMFLIHLILQWRWILGKTRNMFKNAWVLAPVILVAVSVIVIGWYVSPKYGESFKDYGKGWRKGGNVFSESKVDRTGARERPVARSEEPVTKTGGEGRARIHEKEKDFLISGQDSFVSIERKTGVSAGKIIDMLRLPQDVSLTERLGRLKRRHSFSIQDVRDAVDTLSPGSGKRE